jgi:hypothetical protein
MPLKRFLKNALVGIAVAVAALVLGILAEVVWVLLRSYVGESGEGGVWVSLPLPGAGAVVFAAIGLLVGFWWAYRRHRARIGHKLSH